MILTNCKKFLLRQFSFPRRCRATLINGNDVAQKILADLRIEITAFESMHQRKPQLACILIGDDFSNQIYINNKVKSAEKVGIRTIVSMLPSSISKRELVTRIHDLNRIAEVDGILLQLPIPDHIEMDVCNEICPTKDVDGFTSTSLGKLFLNMNTFVPCTALAVHRILKEIDIEIEGKTALVCGRSKHVGLPIVMLLHSSFKHLGFNATTTICHRFTPARELNELCRKADIVISATGIPSLIRGEMVKNKAIVVDVGITRIKDPKTGKSKIVGDVNFDGNS